MSKLETWKDLIGIVQSVATIVALIIGGIWTYRTFIQQRQDKPRLKIEHTVSHWALPNGNTMLSATELLSNSGSIALEIREGNIRVIQVLPLSEHAVRLLNSGSSLPLLERDMEVWPILEFKDVIFKPQEFLIEPGETDRLHQEFVLDKSVQTVAITSYFKNPTARKELGWLTTTYYDIQRPTSAAIEIKAGQDQSKGSGARSAPPVPQRSHSTHR